MDLSENFSNSFDYAKQLFSDFGKLIILIVIDLIPLVNFIVTGYGARVLRETPKTKAPPKLEKYGDMFVDGVKIVVVSLIYMIIPLVLIGMGGAFLITAIIGGRGPGVLGELFLLGGIALALVIVGVILAFLLLILLAAGIAHMIKTDKFTKAFAFGEILSLIGKIGWIRYLGWLIVVAVIAGMVGAIVAAIPYLGWLIGAVISPAVTVFIFRSLGLLYSEEVQPRA